jgi:rRNA small subunit pseudouridine methyltransferase Nep1
MSDSSPDDDRPTKKTRTTATRDNSDHLSSTPLDVVPFSPSTKSSSHNHRHPIIVLLDQATLETVKNKRGVHELLNCDDHRDWCRKQRLQKDPNSYRPDILHQELLALVDSPLNKAGLLKLYISTTNGVLIDVHSAIRVPRTYKRFAGLFVQLLHKMKIKAVSGTSSSHTTTTTTNTTLLKVIKNPFSQYLPAGTRCYGLEPHGTLYSPLALAKALIPELPPDHPTNDQQQQQQPPICFVVGAMATGNVTMEDHPYIQSMIAISEYPLSGACALSRIMGAIEHHWGIV